MKKNTLAFVLLPLGIVILFLLNLYIGSVRIPFNDIVDIFLGKLNVEGFQYKDNGFEVGIWKIYDGDGKLVEVRDYDAPFKNYPWEEVRKFRGL